MLANDLRHIASTGGTSKTPQETSDAIRKMTLSQSCQWMRSAGRPTHKEFTNVLTNVLCGQVLPEGKRDGGPSTGRNGAAAVEARAQYIITDENPNPLRLSFVEDEEVLNVASPA